MSNTEALKRSAARFTAPRAQIRARGVVLSFPRGPYENANSHEALTRRRLAERLAALKGYEFGGDYDAAGRYEAPVYMVPGETLVGVDAAKAIGISGVEDFFGGVVPFPFVATKTITHPLLDARAHAPEGWSGEF